MLHVTSIFVEHVHIFREIKKRRRAQEKATLMAKYDVSFFGFLDCQSFICASFASST